MDAFISYIWLATRSLLKPVLRQGATQGTLLAKFASLTNLRSVVRPRGLEPPRGLTPTRSLVLRVYQFRHGRR